MNITLSDEQASILRKIGVNSLKNADEMQEVAGPMPAYIKKEYDTLKAVVDQIPASVEVPSPEAETVMAEGEDIGPEEQDDDQPEVEPEN